MAAARSPPESNRLYAVHSLECVGPVRAISDWRLYMAPESPESDGDMEPAEWVPSIRGPIEGKWMQRQFVFGRVIAAVSAVAIAIGIAVGASASIAQANPQMTWSCASGSACVSGTWNYCKVACTDVCQCTYSNLPI